MKSSRLRTYSGPPSRARSGATGAVVACVAVAVAADALRRGRDPFSLMDMVVLCPSVRERACFGGAGVFGCGFFCCGQAERLADAAAGAVHHALGRSEVGVDDRRLL